MRTDLIKSAKTPEEKAAARAFKRILAGTLTLILALVLGLMVLMPMCLTQLELEDGPSRTGTVQADGQIRYTDNVHIFLSQEELEAETYGLQPGDKVVIYFDAATGEPTSGYPSAVFDQHQNTRLGILMGFVVVMAVLLLMYALVICRCTPFGSAWYQYQRKQREKDDSDIPLRAKLVIYAVSAVIAIAVCWPQIRNLADQFQKMQRIEAVQELIQSGQAAADQAEAMADALETVGQSGGAENAVSDAEDAAEAIREILDSLNGE